MRSLLIGHLNSKLCNFTDPKFEILRETKFKIILNFKILSCNLVKIIYDMTLIEVLKNNFISKI